jgi:hypothetical protein
MWRDNLQKIGGNAAMSNPNNCQTCDYTKLNGNREGHCYMFSDEPTDVCIQHTGRAKVPPLVQWVRDNGPDRKTSIYERAVESVMGGYKTLR